MKLSFLFIAIPTQPDTSPYALTLRSSFKHKLFQAGIVFGGIVLFPKDKKTQAFEVHLGVFDYCTLGIPLLLKLGWIWAISHKNPFVRYGLGFFIGLPFLIFEAARIITSIVFALNPLTLLVTGMVHLVSEFVAGGKERKETALTLELTNENEQNTTFFLKDKLSHYDSLDVPFELFDCIKVEVNLEDQDKPFLRIFGDSFLSQENISEENIFNGICYLPVFGDEDNTAPGYKNMKALQKLIELNPSHVTVELEKTEKGRTLLNNIMAVI